MQHILLQYNIIQSYKATLINIGLINTTYKITTDSNQQYILQKINTNVFTNPIAIDDNIAALSNFLQQNNASYLFTHPLKTKKGATMLHYQNNCWRMFAYIPNSHSKQILTNPIQAYQAAFTFGNFTNQFNNLNTNLLQTTLPNFHNLAYRYELFCNSLINGNKQRIANCNDEIIFLQQQKIILNTYNEIIANPNFKQRITHHDTKISNVLFNASDDAICVIDLDTVMPGYFISDVGDMMRSYLSPVSEEETDLSKIIIRPTYFDAIKKGYLAAMQGNLNQYEQQHFNYAGSYIIYMQALRFITDYFNNDIYYGIKYGNHNLNRAKNQITLLQQYNSFLNSKF